MRDVPGFNLLVGVNRAPDGRSKPDRNAEEQPDDGQAQEEVHCGDDGEDDPVVVVIGVKVAGSGPDN